MTAVTQYNYSAVCIRKKLLSLLRDKIMSTVGQKTAPFCFRNNFIQMFCSELFLLDI